MPPIINAFKFERNQRSHLEIDKKKKKNESDSNKRATDNVTITSPTSSNKLMPTTTESKIAYRNHNSTVILQSV
jgi:hypothetical protein